MWLFITKEQQIIICSAGEGIALRGKSFDNESIRDLIIYPDNSKMFLEWLWLHKE